ncbi:hypothetical protein BDQ17DRAFT_1255133 [Cyathus striatus]|nr:hypothetical protein BDQ17DRAFT_1255133 [Cyathus striatus]
MVSSASAAALSAAIAQTAATAATAASVATAAANVRAIEVLIILYGVFISHFYDTIKASPSIILCSGSINPEAGCVTIPVVSDTCTSFTGGLSFLDEVVSNAQVPAGFVCTFFSAFGCSSSSPNDRIVLTGGTWDFFSVPGNNGNESFNDEASSFSCSPI